LINFTIERDDEAINTASFLFDFVFSFAVPTATEAFAVSLMGLRRNIVIYKIYIIFAADALLIFTLITTLSLVPKFVLQCLDHDFISVIFYVGSLIFVDQSFIPTDFDTKFQMILIWSAAFLFGSVG